MRRRLFAASLVGAFGAVACGTFLSSSDTTPLTAVDASPTKADGSTHDGGSEGSSPVTVPDAADAGACPRSNGLGQTYDDCTGVYGPETATLACEAFAKGQKGVSCSPVGTTQCLSIAVSAVDSTRQILAIWTWNGNAQGHVVEAERCPTAADKSWGE
jgi:hypothetical protein